MEVLSSSCEDTLQIFLIICLPKLLCSFTYLHLRLQPLWKICIVRLPPHQCCYIHHKLAVWSLLQELQLLTLSFACYQITTSVIHHITWLFVRRRSGSSFAQIFKIEFLDFPVYFCNTTRTEKFQLFHSICDIYL